MVKVIFLGTNGWFDTGTGNTISILVESSKYYIVLDAGNGIFKLGRYVKEKKPVYIFLSHFHLDHIEGLHTLPLNRFLKELHIITQKGGARILGYFINDPFAMPFKNLPFKTKIIEVPKEIKKLPFRASFLPMRHASFTLGIRLEVDGKIIAYCPDTGYCRNVVKLARGADLLITECATSHKADESWPHLNPEIAAKIAKESRAKKLVLTHFGADEYRDMKSREEAEQRARKIFRNSYSSRDGMEIDV